MANGFDDFATGFASTFVPTFTKSYNKAEDRYDDRIKENVVTWRANYKTYQETEKANKKAVETAKLFVKQFGQPEGSIADVAANIKVLGADATFKLLQNGASFKLDQSRSKTSVTTPTSGDANQPTTSDSVIEGMIAPVSGKFPISSKFGPRRAPTSGASENHQGIDLATPEGTPIQAVLDGTISRMGFQEGGAGNYVVIDHGNGVETKYLHLADLPSDIKQGDDVKRGQVFAKSGNTGISTGPHLDFRIVKDGKAIDPEFVFNNQSTDVRTAPDATVPVDSQMGQLGLADDATPEASVEKTGSPDTDAQTEESFFGRLRREAGENYESNIRSETIARLGVSEDVYDKVLAGTYTTSVEGTGQYTLQMPPKKPDYQSVYTSSGQIQTFNVAEASGQQKYTAAVNSGGNPIGKPKLSTILKMNEVDIPEVKMETLYNAENNEYVQVNTKSEEGVKQLNNLVSEGYMKVSAPDADDLNKTGLDIDLQDLTTFGKAYAASQDIKYKQSIGEEVPETLIVAVDAIMQELNPEDLNKKPDFVSVKVDSGPTRYFDQNNPDDVKKLKQLREDLGEGQTLFIGNLTTESKADEFEPPIWSGTDNSYKSIKHQAEMAKGENIPACTVQHKVKGRIQKRSKRSTHSSRIRFQDTLRSTANLTRINLSRLPKNSLNSMKWKMRPRAPLLMIRSQHKELKPIIFLWHRPLKELRKTKRVNSFKLLTQMTGNILMQHRL